MAPKKQKKTQKDDCGNVSGGCIKQLENEVKASKTHDSHKAQASPEQAISEQPTVNTTDTAATRKSRGKRGICAMYKVVVNKARGKKSEVTFNEWGIPDGETRVRLQSYIGMLARTMIPIDIDNWPNVDPELKSKLWLDIQATFKVKPECEDIILKSAGCKWRQFKADLTRKFVMPFVGQKKKLNKPPSGYAYVSKSTWKKFVKQRTDPTWMKIHEVQRERVSQRKYHHRLSRKGYIGLKEDEIKKGRLELGVEPDRAVFWKKARKRKNDEEVEEVDEELAAVCDKIDTLLEKKEKGEIEFSGGEDVLTMVLESREHSGRVRAVAGYITPKQYFKLPREKKIRITKEELMARDRQRDEKVEKKTQALEAEIAHLKAMITSGVSLHSPIQSEKESYQPEKDQPDARKFLVDCDEYKCVRTNGPPTPSPRVTMGQRSCELSVDRIENKVAFGMVYPREDKLSNIVHGIALSVGHQCVSIDGLIKPNALLPVLIRGKMETIRDALGSFLPWPEYLISYTTLIKKKERSRPSAKKSKNDELQKMKAQFFEAKPSEKVPKGFTLLYKHAITWMKTTGVSIQIRCQSDVFGHEKTIYLLHENILALLEFQMLGQAVIASYMAYLHTKISQRPELVETFAFVDPGSTYNLNADFETYIVNRLKEGNSDRLLFLPHNQNMHWILAIIWEGEIYFLNPLPYPTQFPKLEKTLSRAVVSYNSETGRGSNKPPKAKFLNGSPKQPGGHECAYVVMRYMKEIINDIRLTFTTKWLPKTRATYSEAQLDEVRIEALQFIQEHI